MGSGMEMGFLEQIGHYAFQYYGVDWAVTLTVFISLFKLGDKNIAGFLIGMLSAVLALAFSFQIGSIANGVTSVMIFLLYVRGYLKWRSMAAGEKQTAG